MAVIAINSQCLCREKDRHQTQVEAGRLYQTLGQYSSVQATRINFREEESKRTLSPNVILGPR